MKAVTLSYHPAKAFPMDIDLGVGGGGYVVPIPALFNVFLSLNKGSSSRIFLKEILQIYVLFDLIEAFVSAFCIHAIFHNFLHSSCSWVVNLRHQPVSTCVGRSCDCGVIKPICSSPSLNRASVFANNLLF